MPEKNRNKIIEILDRISWNTHLCQLYNSRQELLEILIPYFISGLKNNEFCVLLTGKSGEKESITNELKKSYREIDCKIKQGQIEFLQCSNFNSKKMVSNLLKKIDSPVKRGYRGLRIAIDTSFLQEDNFKFCKKINSYTSKYQMIFLCACSIKKCNINRIIDIFINHDYVLAKKNGQWSIISRLDQTGIEKDIAKPDEFVNNILEAIAHPFYVIDANNYRIIMANSLARNMARITVNTRCYEMTHGRNRPCGDPGHPCTIEEIRKTKRPVVLEHIHYDKDCNQRNIEVHGFPVFDDSGNLSQIIEYALDITERKRAEQMLKEREILLSHTLKLAHLGSWELDLVNNRLTWSEEVYSIFGIKPDEFNYTYKMFLELVHPDDRKIVDDAYRNSIAENKDGYEIEHRIIRRTDKEVRYVYEKCEHIRDQSGRIVRSMGMVCDITEQKNAEEILKRDKETLERIVRERTEELLKSKIELERAKRLSDIGTLAATVAHELRNPLGVIRTAVYNIRRKSKTSILEKHITNIEKKVQESNQIINNLLFYSRLKAPQYETTDICNFLKESINAVKSKYKDYDTRFELKCDVVTGLLIDIDTYQISEVLNNVLNNAVESLRDGKGTIRVGVRKIDSFLEITVSDTGTGIEKENLDKIFEPFFTTKSKGTGLGLTVCRQIIDLHNGDIKIESEKNKGTKVTILLPLVRRSNNEKKDIVN